MRFFYSPLYSPFNSVTLLPLIIQETFVYIVAGYLKTRFSPVLIHPLGGFLSILMRLKRLDWQAHSPYSESARNKKGKPHA